MLPLLLQYVLVSCTSRVGLTNSKFNIACYISKKVEWILLSVVFLQSYFLLIIFPFCEFFSPGIFRSFNGGWFTKSYCGTRWHGRLHFECISMETRNLSRYNVELWYPCKLTDYACLHLMFFIQHKLPSGSNTIIIGDTGF